MGDAACIEREGSSGKVQNEQEATLVSPSVNWARSGSMTLVLKALWIVYTYLQVRSIVEVKLRTARWGPPHIPPPVAFGMAQARRRLSGTYIPNVAETEQVPYNSSRVLLVKCKSGSSSTND